MQSKRTLRQEKQEMKEKYKRLVIIFSKIA